MATAKVISKVVTEVAMERQAVTLDSATQAVITEFVATRDMLTSLEKIGYISFKMIFFINKTLLN